MFWLLVSVAATACLAYVLYLILKPEDSEFSSNSFDDFIGKPSSTNDCNDTDVKESKRTVYDKPGHQILILYGTEYGYSEELAQQLQDKLEKELLPVNKDWQPRVLNARHYERVDFEQERYVFVLISTAGDGIPPTEARSFVDSLHDHPHSYPHLHYSVLAMGDSNYPHYCRAGKQVDQLLCNLKAQRLAPYMLVDQEDSTTVTSWMNAVTNAMKAQDVANVELTMDYIELGDEGQGGEEGPSRTRPVDVTLNIKYNLTEESCDKETVHCEFDIAGKGLTWTAGDALGIYCNNNPADVDNLLGIINRKADDKVALPKHAYNKEHLDTTITLQKALSCYYDLKNVKPELIHFLCNSSSGTHYQGELETLLSDGLSLKTNVLLQSYLEERDLLDVLSDYADISRSISLVDLLSYLKPLLPRYYSIASSPLISTDTLCITAAVVRYTCLRRERGGVATTHIQDRLDVNDTLPAFISHNPEFRLPTDSSAARVPVVMIGPGTGIAPFRAFIQQRALEGVRACDTILYFGCRHERGDFLYKKELERWVSQDRLTLRTAFSRDQEHKVYVQDLILEDQQNIWELLEQRGAHIYVCGDARHMAHDVHKALVNIVMKMSDCNETEAQLYLERLEKEHRYQKDVWVT